LTRQALKEDFKNIDPKSTRIILVEAGERLLAPFHPELSAYAEKKLGEMGVEVWCNHMVEDCDDLGITINGDYVPAETIIWAAGVAATPAAKWLDVKTDRTGRIEVDGQLKVAGFENIYCIGDVAQVEDGKGRILPGIAPVAKQQGKFIAQYILDANHGVSFKYRDVGIQATIGRDAAVIQYGRFRMTGRIAWWLWSIAHIYFLMTTRSRISMFTSWLWSCFTLHRHSRLIIGRENPQAVANEPKPPQINCSPRMET
jgi:NADH dehydrogenase